MIHLLATGAGTGVTVDQGGHTSSLGVLFALVVAGFAIRWFKHGNKPQRRRR